MEEHGRRGGYPQPARTGGEHTLEGPARAAIDQVVARYQLDIDFTTIPTWPNNTHLRLG